MIYLWPYSNHNNDHTDHMTVLEMRMMFIECWQFLQMHVIVMMIAWWTWYHGVDDDAEHEQVVRQVRCQIAFSTLQWYFHHHQHNYFPPRHHHHHRKWPHGHHQHRPNRSTATLMVAICAPEKYAPVMHWYAPAVALQARISDFNQGANYNHLHVISSTAQIAQLHIYLLPLHIIFTETHAWYKVHCK